MKKIITFSLLFAVCAITNAQIVKLNADCSQGGLFQQTATGWYVPGYSVTTTVTGFNAATSGIVNGKLVLTGTSTTQQSNMKLITDSVDISSNIAKGDTSFVFTCKLYLGTSTSTAAPYTTNIVALDGTGAIVTTGTTLVKIVPNTNVTAGTEVIIGGNMTIKNPNITKLSLVIQFGKMLGNTLYFDDFTLSTSSSTTTVGTASNSTLSYEAGKGPSDESNFTVSGSGLGTDNIVLTPATNMEISTTSGSGFVANPSTITLTPASGEVASTSIYARLKAGVNPGAISASSTRVTIGHPAAGSKTVQFTCTVYGITATTPTNNILSYTEGNGPSGKLRFNVQGYLLNENLVVTPGSNLEISLDSLTNYASTPVTLVPASGTVASTTIFSRLKAGLTAATYSDATTMATISSSGFTTIERQFIGSVIQNTAVESINSAFVKCIVDKGTLHISGVEIGQIIDIYNNLGQRVQSVTASDTNTIQLPAKGIYIVKSASFVEKVLVK